MISLRKSVKAKLMFGSGLMLALVGVLGAFSVFTIERTSAVTESMYTKNLSGLHIIQELDGLVAGLHADVLAVLMTRVTNQGAGLSNSVQEAREKFASSWSRYFPELVTTDEEKQAAQRVWALHDAFFSTLDAFVEKVQGDNMMGARGYYTTRLQSRLAALAWQLNNLTELQVKAAAQAYADGVATATFNKRVIIGVLVVVLLLTVVITSMLTRMIARPLRRAHALAEAIAKGRLDNTVENPFKDEFGSLLTALTNMQQQLAEIVADVRDRSETVSAGASRIASGNDELSSRTQEQAASLEETATSMEQMTSTVKQNADNAAQADQLTQGVRSQASEGGEVIGRAVEAMQVINEASRKIADITGMIDDIAFQTNLLALNASVEAARAGEQGRGFAVVASEVRNLASRSAKAAKEIKELVNDSAAKVEDGSQQVELSGRTLAEIVESINKVSDIVSEIAAASGEQSSGIEQVNLAVSQMDSMTQQNASLVEESAAASRSLEEQADALKRQVAFFKLAGGADDAGTMPQLAASVAAGQQPDGASAPDPAEASRAAVDARPVSRRPARGAAGAATIDDEEEWAAF